MVCARTSAHRMLRNVQHIYIYWCMVLQLMEPGEPKPVSAPLETAPSLESPPQLDVVQYTAHVFKEFSVFLLRCLAYLYL